MVAGHSRHVAFDLDGVLIDSRAAVKAAYLSAGVEQPDDAWGKPAESWLPDLTDEPGAVHEAKQRAYPRALVNHARPLAGTEVARRLLKDRVKVTVVTHASWRSATAALAFLKLDVPLYSVVGLKGPTLWRLGPSCYVDDIVPLDTVPYDIAVIPFIDDVDKLELLVRSHL